METMRERSADKAVPCRMKFHFIDPVAKTVVCSQNRSVLVGLKTPADHLFRAQETTVVRNHRFSPSRALPLQSLGQGSVCFEEIVFY